MPPPKILETNNTKVHIYGDSSLHAYKAVGFNPALECFNKAHWNDAWTNVDLKTWAGMPLTKALEWVEQVVESKLASGDNLQDHTMIVIWQGSELCNAQGKANAEITVDQIASATRLASLMALYGYSFMSGAAPAWRIGQGEASDAHNAFMMDIFSKAGVPTVGYDLLSALHLPYSKNKVGNFNMKNVDKWHVRQAGSDLDVSLVQDRFFRMLLLWLYNGMRDTEETVHFGVHGTAPQAITDGLAAANDERRARLEQTFPALGTTAPTERSRPTWPRAHKGSPRSATTADIPLYPRLGRRRRRLFARNLAQRGRQRTHRRTSPRGEARGEEGRNR